MLQSVSTFSSQRDSAALDVSRGCFASRGSVSLVFATVLMPMIMLCLSLVVELSQFFTERSLIQAAVDNETRMALQRGLSGEALELALRQRIESLGTVAEATTIRHFVSGQFQTVSIQGRYHGPLLGLVSRFSKSAALAIPFELRTSVRRASAAMAVLFDRSVSSGAAPCGDLALRRIAKFVEALVMALEAQLGVNVTVATFPGPSATLAELRQDNTGSDGLARCPYVVGTLEPSVRFAVEGVERTAIDPAELAAQSYSVVTNRVLSVGRELTSLVVVLSHSAQSETIASAVVASADRAAREHRKSLRVIVLFVDAPSSASEHQRGEWIDLTNVHLSREALVSGALVQAIRGLIADRVVIAQ